MYFPCKIDQYNIPPITDRALQENPGLGGQFYFVPDNTPVQSTFTFMEPFLAAQGFQMSRFRLPYTPVYYGLVVAEWIAWLLSPFVHLSLPTESYSLRYINMHLYFSGRKAEQELGFKPIFSPKLSLHRSLQYYKSLKL